MIVHIFRDNHAIKHSLQPYAETTKVFTDEEAAVEHYYAAIGGTASLMGMPIRPKVGNKQVYMCGDIDVELLTLETVSAD